ncbi:MULTISPECIES: hypothetical protein [unclassified Sinorhizobium]|uniref:hypothetical protein n=1 Tax=unclassified Sinorhizobium TaxID=2613772 RepID=UPI00352324CD
MQKKRRDNRPTLRHAPVANDNNVPLLTIERAIADGLSPTSLRQVADANMSAGSARHIRQAQNLYRVADRLELLGYGRERAVA